MKNILKLASLALVASLYLPLSAQTPTDTTAPAATQAKSTVAPLPPITVPTLNAVEAASIREKIADLDNNDLRYQLAVSQQSEFEYKATKLKSELSQTLIRLGQKHNIPGNWSFDFKNLVFTPPGTPAPAAQ